MFTGKQSRRAAYEKTWNWLFGEKQAQREWESWLQSHEHRTPPGNTTITCIPEEKFDWFLCLLLYRKQNTRCSTSSKWKSITEDKEEESAIISFWVISHVKTELVSDILETVSVLGIGVLCDERQNRTTSSQPNCALRIPRFWGKMQGEALSTNPDDRHRNDLRKLQHLLHKAGHPKIIHRVQKSWKSQIKHGRTVWQ